MSPRIAIATAVVLLLAGVGCTTSRKIATRDELANLPMGQPIMVYGRDDRVYRLTQHVLLDSEIRGVGTLTQRRDRAPFDGAIPLDSIIAVKTDSRSRMRALAMAGITVLFTAYVVEGNGSSGGLKAVEDLVYRGPTGGGSSCPYVYAWDGSRYQLAAEPFGIAWGRALELATVHLLPAARPDHGVVRLRLANERRETHYVNSVRLRAIDLGSAPAAVLDGDGTPWPLVRPVAPVAASERSGREVLSEVTSAEGHMWECDPASLAAGSGYEDVLEVSLPRPRGTTEGMLVVTGINTTLSTAIFDRLCCAVGGETAALAHAVETDPELIAQLRRYLDDASLAASVWNGSEWEPVGAFRPEASAVAFTRALRIRVPDGAGNVVRVRLRAMADVWKIDAIAADWSDARPLAWTPLPLRSAIGPEGEDLREDLGADDRRYAILLPPDRVELAFAAPARAGARLTYAVEARGYLHEWDPADADAEPAGFVSMVPKERRIDVVKELLEHRELALQPVYEAWARDRAR